MDCYFAVLTPSHFSDIAFEEAIERYKLDLISGFVGSAIGEDATTTRTIDEPTDLVGLYLGTELVLYRKTIQREQLARELSAGHHIQISPDDIVHLQGTGSLKSKKLNTKFHKHPTK